MLIYHSFQNTCFTGAAMGSSEKFCLRWNDFEEKIKNSFYIFKEVLRRRKISRTPVWFVMEKISRLTK